MFAVMKDDLYKHSKSIVLIKNPKTNTCFMKAFVLGLMQLEDKKDDSYWRHPNTKKWTEEMNALHLVLSLTLTMNVGPQDMMELADSFQVIIRCFHVNGIKPGFFHALPKVTRTHVTCTFCSTQIISITNPKMSGVLKIFRHSQYACFYVLVLCNKEYFAN